MIVIIMGLIGAVIGGQTARKRQGNRKDIAQYAAGYGIAFMLAGLIITVLVDRLFLAG
ncbi:apolipoprotein acyltransferase [uncultured Sulfitobacter sp.]|uniref:apolipoprotein acyltransferase n=1 Tax=uncultured Sulfitobacter sp. TaxID=191468 RepID=UPI0026032572|nr:apolipoprotein acyltransferase [uncultured Sulfitobacter sp.]